MTAARTIPDTHRRRTSIALIMSYNIVATKALLQRARTAEAKMVFPPRAIPMFAPHIGWTHLRTPHNNKLCESAKLSMSAWEDQFVPYCCLHCLPRSNPERQTL